MTNHFTMSMSVKVLVISVRVLTTLFSVNDNWFIRPNWGELELVAMARKHHLTIFIWIKDCWKYLSEIIKVIRSCAQ